MATEEVKSTPDLQSLFTQLAEPFDPSEIKWRVTHTTRDGGRGAVIAFADPRAYTDRLNQLFTPTGWTRAYEVSTVSAVTRMKKDKPIQTGKVMVTCTLSITGLGCHTGSGEEWADEENALTAAEYRQPIQFPKLPHWALPKENTTGKTHPAAGSRPAVVQHGPIDQKTTVRIEGFRRILGDPIYGEILRRVAHAQRAIDIPNAQAQAQVADAMERASRGIRKAHSLSESIGDTQFVSLLDRLHIGTISAIPSLESLKTIVSELEGLAGSPAA